MAKLQNQINDLWDAFGAFIGQAYAVTKDTRESSALHDYAPDVHWHDGLADLLKRETANEKQHRGNRSLAGFSAQTAAKLILLGAAVQGSEMTEAPSSLDFLYCRHEAIEARVLGFLIRETATNDWRESVRTFDYTKIMQAA